MNKFIVLAIGYVFFSLNVNAQTPDHLSKKERSNLRKEKINQLIKQEEEGALIFRKQGLFGFKLNTDGWSMIYEHGKYKTITKTTVWWMELGERKDKKQEKLSSGSSLYPGLAYGNPFVYGKENNFYYFKLGLGGQYLIGGKGNKNGVAVALIYGGGFSLGMLKPYYLEIQNGTTNAIEDIKYTGSNDSVFLYGNILGASGFGKGFNEMKYVAGAHVRTALRFDYGRYNEILSAIELGLNLEYYSEKMPIMVWNDPHHAFLNAYLAIEFGKRK